MITHIKNILLFGLFLTLLFTASTGVAQGPPPSKLMADFTMTRTLAVLEDSIESSGKLFIGGDGLLRWETILPTKSTLVVNSTRAWLYYPEFGIVKDFDLGSDPTMSVLSKHLLALTSGDFDKIEKLYSIEELGEGRKRLIPTERAVKKMFREMRVTIGSNGAAKQVELVSTNGDITSILFKNVNLNPKLSPTLFTNPK